MAQEQKTRLIMYVGRKLHGTRDRANPKTTWDKPGDVAEVSANDAARLLKYEGNFEDVTELSEKPDALAERSRRVFNRIQEDLRAAVRDNMPIERTLKAASIEQIVEELASRGVDVSGLDVGSADIQGQETAYSDVKTAPPTPKPSDDGVLNDQIIAGFEALTEQADQSSNPAGLFNEDGLPKADALSQVLGYDVTDDEIRSALS